MVSKYGSLDLIGANPICFIVQLAKWERFRLQPGHEGVRFTHCTPTMKQSKEVIETKIQTAYYCDTCGSQCGYSCSMCGDEVCVECAIFTEAPYYQPNSYMSDYPDKICPRCYNAGKDFIDKLREESDRHDKAIEELALLWGNMCLKLKADKNKAQ